MESLSLLQKPPKSIQKIVRRPPSITYNDSFYSGKYSFELDDTQGGLVQTWIKVVTNTGGDIGFVNVPQGLNLFHQIRLVGETGPIQTLDRVTLLARTDLIIGSAVYFKLHTGITGIEDPVSGDTTYFIPLFWFFSDLPGDYLDLKNKGPMWIEIITLPSKEAMGMEFELTSMTFELYSYYKQFKDYVPKPISNTYDRFLEETTKVPSGTSSVEVTLKCPSEVFYLHFYLLNDSAGSDQITSVKLEGPSSELFDLHYAMNYLLSSDDSMDNSSVFSIPFGPRHGEGDFITFGQSMSPTYATVTFPPSGSNRTLYAQSEFRSKISGSDDRPYQDISGLLIN